MASNQKITGHQRGGNIPKIFAPRISGGIEYRYRNKHKGWTLMLINPAPNNLWTVYADVYEQSENHKKQIHKESLAFTIHTNQLADLKARIMTKKPDVREIK